MYRTDLDSVGEGKGGMFWENSIETCILSSVKQITSPGWMHETSAQGWCTGKTQRDGMGREVVGGSGWGISLVNPWLIHVNVWQKTLQYCKVISLQLIKINGKKKDTCTQIFMAALFTIGRTRKQPRCPSGEEWIKKMGSFPFECEWV